MEGSDYMQYRERCGTGTWSIYTTKDLMDLNTSLKAAPTYRPAQDIELQALHGKDLQIERYFGISLHFAVHTGYSVT